MTTTGRTHWLAKDCGWWRRERIIELGEEFGADGPGVLDWLSCEAKAQNDGGWVKTGYRSLSRGCFVSPEVARNAVSRAVTLGLLDDYEEVGSRFTCRISGWKDDQEKAQAADRQAEYRARKAGNSEESPPSSNGLSQGVTECPPTGQDRTGQKTTTSTSELAKASTDSLRLSHLLASLILEHDPKAKVKPDSNAWLRAMRLLLADRDGDVAEVEQVLRWAQADGFWHVNILSPGKLREKFTQLITKMQSEATPAPSLTEAPTRWAEMGKQWAAEDAAAETARSAA